MKRDDELLLEASQKLDEKAITTIFDRFSPGLYKYALRLCHLPDVADDIVLSVFTQFLEGLASNKTSNENLRAYFYKTAYQLLLDHARANPQNALVEQTLFDEYKQVMPASYQSEEQSLVRALTSAFNTELTFEQRHVIVLRFLEDFSIKDTSLIIGKTVSNVKVIQNRAVAKLRKAMGLEKGGNPPAVQSDEVNLDRPNSSTNEVLSSMLTGTLTDVASVLPGSKSENFESYEPKETRLYVGNLPYSLNNEKLMGLFSKAGTVKSAKVFKDNKRLTNFAYVVMSTLEEAIRAMYMYHRKNFDGQYLAVKIGEKELSDDLDDFPSGILTTEKRHLRVFLCHAHKDASSVHAIYQHLIDNNIEAWLDKEKLLPGSDWEHEIRQAVRTSDIVVICLSKGFNERGFRQKEVRIALEESALQPEGEIFIVPARLEECEVLPSLRHLHWVNLFDSDGYEKLMRTLRVRAQKIGALFN
jgi:RNA polymerase sigma factor (sigma-70 family)